MLKTLGIEIKNIRTNQGISQQRLSDMTGIMREQISKIENGQVNFTIETLYKFSLAFNMPLNKLLDFDIESFEEDYHKIITAQKIRPFVKWAGGKTQILEELKASMPSKFNTYFEPFVGGGAFLFDIKPKNAVINDFNSELITVYNIFKDKKEFNKMIKKLDEHELNHSEKYYLKIREMDRKDNYNKLPKYEIGARMIYLNKSCFNGLYRVNSKGYFNVPSGKREKVNTYDLANLKALYSYFNSNNVEILNGDFSLIEDKVKKGDFIYFDPPYDSYPDKTGFTAYTKNSFDDKEQTRLRDLYKRLSDKGAYVMLSNHNTPLINELFKDFNIRVIKAKRMINSKASGRVPVEEVIITNY